jgi:hypothetical protein
VLGFVPIGEVNATAIEGTVAGLDGDDAPAARVES